MNHQTESRMREIRLSGLEGGGAKPIVSPYPYPRNHASIRLSLKLKHHAAEAGGVYF